MNTTENPGGSSWIKIQSGLRDIERLISQKKYNLVMIKSRQTLEYMVKCLCTEYNIAEGNLIDMIDDLLDSGTISKTSHEHYHSIRMIGNKAIHEEDSSAYNANHAYHLLSQEIYVFSNDYSKRKPRSSQSSSARRYQEEEPRPAAPRRSTSRRKRARSSGPSFDAGSLIKPILLIAIIVVLIFIIKMIRPSKPAEKDTTAPVSSEEMTEAPTEATTVAEPESTMAPAALLKYKVTGDKVNVRSDASTTNAPLGSLTTGTEIDYVEGSDQTDSEGRTWCIIKYNGQDAYIVKDYIAPVSQ